MTDENTIESIREEISQTLTEINALTWAIENSGDAQAMHLQALLTLRDDAENHLERIKTIIWLRTLREATND